MNVRWTLNAGWEASKCLYFDFTTAIVFWKEAANVLFILLRNVLEELDSQQWVCFDDGKTLAKRDFLGNF